MERDMSTTTVDAEPAEPAGHGEPAIIRRPWPFGCCPTCGDDRFTVGPAQGTAVFTCVGCGASWRYLLGCLIRLDPDPTSPINGNRHRTEPADHPAATEDELMALGTAGDQPAGSVREQGR